MTSVVITGSSRGIGFGLAESFLRLGCSVTLNGRSEERLVHASHTLEADYGSDVVAQCAGDVTNPDDLERLWQVAVDAFGAVDIWINNAGVGHPMRMVWELPADVIGQIVDVNVTGAILGSRTAVRHMIDQGHGHVYNMEGFGSNGRTRRGLSVYGSSKAALRFLNRSLAAEVRSTPVKASALSPGMVMTDFILDQYRDDPEGLERAKPIFNIIADRPERVTPWLARKVLANRRSGRLINWLPAPRVFWRFATAWARKRDIVSTPE